YMEVLSWATARPLTTTNQRASTVPDRRLSGEGPRCSRAYMTGSSSPAGHAHPGILVQWARD
ncbi:MAG TPA: hypothetical protein VFT01_00720, partial [Homoserinimonas sp.]|nr:hypothetical protein [Homoserinimonas sp.]